MPNESPINTLPGYVWAIDARDDDVTRMVLAPIEETALYGLWRYVRELATVGAVCGAFAILVSILSL